MGAQASSTWRCRCGSKRENLSQSNQQGNRSREFWKSSKIHTVRCFSGVGCWSRIGRTTRCNPWKTDWCTGWGPGVYSNWSTWRWYRFSVRGHDWAFLGSRRDGKSRSSRGGWRLSSRHQSDIFAKEGSREDDHADKGNASSH